MLRAAVGSLRKGDTAKSGRAAYVARYVRLPARAHRHPISNLYQETGRLAADVARVQALPLRAVIHGYEGVIMMGQRYIGQHGGMPAEKACNGQAAAIPAYREV